jgi:hypothetical protein
MLSRDDFESKLVVGGIESHLFEGVTYLKKRILFVRHMDYFINFTLHDELLRLVNELCAVFYCQRKIKIILIIL